MRDIQRVGEALATRQDEIGRAIAARILAETPEYDGAPAALIADVEAGARATVGLLARAFATGAMVAPDDLEVVRSLAARRVHQGVSHEVFVNAYRVALFAFWDACAEEAARLDVSRDASLALGRFALDAMDLMTTHAAEGYLREDARLRRESGRKARDLVERLIRGQPLADTWRVPDAPLVTVVGRIAATDLPTAEALQRAYDALEEILPQSLIAVREGEVILVGNSPRGLRETRERVLERYHVDIRFGVSHAAQDHADVEQSYREAALSLAYSSAARPIVSLDDLSALECALIGADATTRAVIAAKAGPVRELPDEDLATVRAFADADLNVGRAATALDVHPNTVRYRLGRIATATGHDPRTFSGLVELVCIMETSE